uniref:Uncharacterized protein n=1 Tax=Arundo donax TaxID=35708 RepID=A0A0A9HZ28_ARUDO
MLAVMKPPCERRSFCFLIAEFDYCFKATGMMKPSALT